jgi:hypothetical protein
MPESLMVLVDVAAAPESYERIRAEFDGFSSGAYLRLLGQLSPHAAPPVVLGQFPGPEMERVRGWLDKVTEPAFADIARRAARSALPLPRFSDAWHAFTQLADLNSGPDGISPALVYLAALATEVGGELGEVMTTWVDQQVRQLGIEEAFAERRREMAGARQTARQTSASLRSAISSAWVRWAPRSCPPGHPEYS